MNVNAAANAGNVRLLADGNEVPVLGLGVWQVPDGPACVNAVRWALDAGYRHIDTAQAYGNEESVGRALRDSGVPRNEVFVTTKFHPGGHDPVAQAEQSLRRRRYVGNRIVAKIAHRTGRTPAQVLLRWCLQHGVIAVAKSTHRDRIQENAQIFDFTLSADDMTELDGMDKTGGIGRALEDKWW